MERGRVLDFLEGHPGAHRVGREDEYDRVGLTDQRFDALPPILERINLFPVDQWHKAARLERGFEPIREGHVPARIRDENSRLAVDVTILPCTGNHAKFPDPGRHNSKPRRHAED